MFTEKDFGKPIRQELRVRITRYTTRQDYADVARKHKVSPSLMKQVVSRTANLTEKNSKPMNSLVATAYENCKKKIPETQADKAYFETLIIKN